MYNNLNYYNKKTEKNKAFSENFPLFSLFARPNGDKAARFLKKFKKSLDLFERICYTNKKDSEEFIPFHL